MQLDRIERVSFWTRENRRVGRSRLHCGQNTEFVVAHNISRQVSVASHHPACAPCGRISTVGFGGFARSGTLQFLKTISSFSSRSPPRACAISRRVANQHSLASDFFCVQATLPISMLSSSAEA